MNIIKGGKSLVNKHGSTACVVFVIVGIGLTVYETWKARPKVDKIMDEYKEAVKDIQEDETKTEEEKKKAVNGEKVEVAKKVTLVMTPVIISGLATGGFAVAGHVMDARKIANMAATIEIGDLAYRKLENKLCDIYGEKEAKEIIDSVNKDDARQALDAAYAADSELNVIEQGIGGHQVYYVPDFGCLFRSDDHSIINACHELNEKINCKPFGPEPYIGYDEFFDHMGISIPRRAYHFVFDINNPLRPDLNNTIKYGDIACTVLEWYNEPKYMIK